MNRKLRTVPSAAQRIGVVIAVQLIAQYTYQARALEYFEICSDIGLHLSIGDNLNRPIRTTGFDFGPAARPSCGFQGKTLIFTSPSYQYTFKDDCIDAYNLAKSINQDILPKDPIAHYASSDHGNSGYSLILFDNKTHSISISGASTALTLLGLPEGKDLQQTPVKRESIIGYSRVVFSADYAHSCALIAE